MGAGRDVRDVAGRQRVRHVLGRVHVDRELRPVARRQVAVAALGDLLVVDVLARAARTSSRARSAAPTSALRRRRGRGSRCPASPCGRGGRPACWRASCERSSPRRVEERHPRARVEPGHVDLLDAPARVERRLGRARAARQRERDGGSPHQELAPRPHRVALNHKGARAGRSLMLRVPRRRSAPARAPARSARRRPRSERADAMPARAAGTSRVPAR